jgi:hypothetical protein
MEFRIEDTAGLGGERIVARVVNGPVEGSGGIICKHAMNAEPRRQVSMGHVPKFLRGR